jgi:hypothetical protein
MATQRILKQVHLHEVSYKDKNLIFSRLEFIITIIVYSQFHL